MIHKVFTALFTLILAFFVAIIVPETTASARSRIVDALESDAKQIRDTSSYIFGAPLRLDVEDWGAVGMFGITTFLFAQEKRTIHETFRDMRSNESDNAADIFKIPGERYVIPAATVLIYSGGLVFDAPRERKMGLMMAESISYTGVCTLMGQYIFSEKRPIQGGKLRFFKTGGHGVSGHSSMFAAIAGPINATYLKMDLNDPTGLKALKISGKIATYGLPVLTGWSRINDDKHYLWNVVLGMGIGYTFGELVTWDRSDVGLIKNKYVPRPGVAFLPHEGTALTLRWEW